MNAPPLDLIEMQREMFDAAALIVRVSARMRLCEPDTCYALGRLAVSAETAASLISRDLAQWGEVHP